MKLDKVQEAKFKTYLDFDYQRYIEFLTKELLKEYAVSKKEFVSHTRTEIAKRFDELKKHNPDASDEQIMTEILFSPKKKKK